MKFLFSISWQFLLRLITGLHLKKKGLIEFKKLLKKGERRLFLEKEEPKNLWETDECALAFSDQTISLPYRQSLQALKTITDIKPGSIWLDLGCGSGEIIELIWEKSQGSVSEIIGLDCAQINERLLYERIDRFRPPPHYTQIEFICGDFRKGLPQFREEYFDGVTAGFCLAYADHFNDQLQKWDRSALYILLRDINRTLKPGGQFILLTNVPNANFFKIIFQTIAGAVKEGRLFEAIKKILRMKRFTKWVKKGVSDGRFHYLSIKEWTELFLNFGFNDFKYHIACADQAYLISAMKI